MGLVRTAVSTVLIGCLAAVSGCGVRRAELSNPELERRAAATKARMLDDYRVLTEKMIRRMHRETKERDSGVPNASEIAFDVLILSGGGDYGAFGAGVLTGWGSVKGELRRPDFDVVTGVSTGALIAPFAFLGDDESYAQVEGLYREPRKDWIESRGMFFFMPWNSSFADTAGLRRDLKMHLPPIKIQRIADCSATDRALVIGTTNLDMGTMRGFALGEESEEAAYTGEYERFYDILMASAAIPGAFPPVVIDDEIYVDGGTTSNILFGSNLRARQSLVGAWKAQYPNLKPVKLRMWVIINNQLGVHPTQVQPKWPSIVGSSLSTAIRFSTIASLRNLQAQAELMRVADGIDCEFRYIAIPGDWRAPVDGAFKKETMESLADLGEKLGADPASWMSELPLN